MSINKIPFSIEISRVIELLSAQIYPTPFALLRENVQNAYDAILLRLSLGQDFTPQIKILIEAKKLEVSDNGIGMTVENLRDHYWRAGSSSKNTKEAREAGVVGTFGIGAMANFGIAEDLVVVTESAITNERTMCKASRSTLSVTEDCIQFEQLPSAGSSGTKITAIVQEGKSIDIDQAKKYIIQFVEFLSVEVTINDEVVSGNNLENSLPDLNSSWKFSETNFALGNFYTGDIDMSGSITGEVRVTLKNIYKNMILLSGVIILRQGYGVLKTYRKGFGLATTSVSSFYQFGGVADFLFLNPTAGREALTTNSMAILQDFMTQIDKIVSEQLSKRPECNSNNSFISWVHNKSRYELCDNIRVNLEPGDSITLKDVKEKSKANPVLVYFGTNSNTLKLASSDKPVITISKTSPRKYCESNYLKKYCRIQELDDNPNVKLRAENELTEAEFALGFRLESILSTDYFLETKIRFGEISHSLPMIINKGNPVEIILNNTGSNVQLIFELFKKQYLAYGHMVKDFVRNVIFPKISDLVPSATRQGAEAFLKSINRTREVFEYEAEDLEDLRAIWEDHIAGKSNTLIKEDVEKIIKRSYQVLSNEATARVRDVISDVIENEESILLEEDNNNSNLEPLPPIQRLDVSTPKKLLFIDEDENSFKGYRCFLAITERIRNERGDFFLQPHRTSIVWGGQKALFIFQHHSGNFGLYYDLQTQDLISTESGGGSFETCTIVMKNQIFIPIPDQIRRFFMPKENEKKRFEVKCDILYIDSNNA